MIDLTASEEMDTVVGEYRVVSNIHFKVTENLQGLWKYGTLAGRASKKRQGDP